MNGDERSRTQTGPDTLASLWVWAVELAREARMAEPYRIHSREGDRDDWGAAQSEAIRGLPFSRPFERYLDVGISASLQEALQSLRPPRSDRGTLPARLARQGMYAVVRAIVRDGQTEQETCRMRLGMSAGVFHGAAVNGILALRSALGRTS